MLVTSISLPSVSLNSKTQLSSIFVRGNTISTDIVQINLVVKKAGSKKLEEVFKKEEKKEGEDEKPAEAGGEEKPAQEKKEEVKE